MNYVVLFPECKNVHLVKRVGMIPYHLYNLYGWDATIACYQNEKEYSYLEEELKGVKLKFIKKIFNNSRLDGLNFILKYAKSIDVLQVFHIHSTRNYYWISLYKYLNPKGQVYLMLDTSYGLVYDNPFGKGILKKFRMSVLHKCSLISAETESTAHGLTDKWGVKVECVNNGFYLPEKNKVKFEEKENIICTVGRIGSYQKNTEVLLKAFAIFASKNNEWKLRVVGPIEEKFKEYIENFLHENPALIDRVFFIGEIKNRNELFHEYKKAKIFCLTSRWEGFAVSYMEALSAGCFIISSDVYSAFDVTNYQKYGLIFSVGDYIGLYNCICRVSNEEELLRKCSLEAQEFVIENYNWEKNAQKIYEFLNTSKTKKK